MAKNKKTVIKRINCKTDKKLRNKLLAASALVTVVLAAMGCCIENIGYLFGGLGMGRFLLRFGLIVLSFAMCMAICELLRRLLMKKLGVDIIDENKWLLYTSTGKMSLKNFAVISFAPVLAVAAVLVLLMLVLPGRLFWVVYIIFIFNFACAVEDVYAFALAKKLKADTIQCIGSETLIYGK